MGLRVILFLCALVVGVSVFLFAGSDSEETPEAPVATIQSAPTPHEVTPSPLADIPELNSMAPDRQRKDPYADIRPADTYGPYFGEVVRFWVRTECDDDGECNQRVIAEHEYEDYTIEELTTIARMDGAAALVLASKLGAQDFEKARPWALRAFLLTRDPYAYHMTANYSGVFFGESTDSEGKLDRASAERAYVWAKIGYELGGNDGFALTSMEQILDKHGFIDRQGLDEQASRHIERLAKKRLELTGQGF